MSRDSPTAVTPARPRALPQGDGVLPAPRGPDARDTLGSQARPTLTRLRVGQATARALAVAGSVVAGVPASGQDPPQEVVTEMRDAGFSDAQIRSAGAGGIVTRILPRGDENAVFVAGVVRVAASDDALVGGIRSLEALRRGGRTLQIGRFSTPPRTEDLRELTIERRDLDDLRRCQVGDCGVKIGRAAMASIRAVDWQAVDARERAAWVTKEALLARLKAYLDRGSSAMAAYDDDDPPESVAHGFEKILAESPDLVRRNPAFYRHLLDFPNGEPPPNMESFFYWSKEKLRKPVVSIVHAALQHREGSGQASYSIAMKHIYDSHYFRAYADFLTAIPEAGTPRSFYLIRSVRTLIDPPRGWFRGFLLGRIKHAMRDELAGDLRRTRVRLESGARVALPSDLPEPDGGERSTRTGNPPLADRVDTVRTLTPVLEGFLLQTRRDRRSSALRRLRGDAREGCTRCRDRSIQERQPR